MKAYIDLTLAMFISGSAVVVNKMMVTSIPAFLATELGILIGMLILIPYTFGIKKELVVLDWKTHFVLFAQAVCGIFLYRICTFTGLMFTSAATSGLITSASPIIVVFLAFFILKEKISLQQIFGVLIVVTGLFIINFYSYITAGTGKCSIKGNLLIMAAVICEGMFSILSKIKCKEMSAIYRTTNIVFYAFLLLLPFSIRDALQFNFVAAGYKTWFCVLYYGIFVTFLSYIFWFRGIENVQANHAAVFTSVVPVSSIVLSAILLRETILPVHIICLVCIIAGILISVRNNSN
jgi:Permeases of the drug/metabolite transporter (DMT) superfamily